MLLVCRNSHSGCRKEVFVCPSLRRIAQQKEGMKESFGLLEAISENQFPGSWEWDTEWHFAFLERRRAPVKHLMFSVFFGQACLFVCLLPLCPFCLSNTYPAPSTGQPSLRGTKTGADENNESHSSPTMGDKKWHPSYLSTFLPMLVIQQALELGGAAEARRAHNPEVPRSKRGQASHFWTFLPFFFGVLE